MPVPGSLSTALVNEASMSFKLWLMCGDEVTVTSYSTPPFWLLFSILIPGMNQRSLSSYLGTARWGKLVALCWTHDGDGGQTHPTTVILGVACSMKDHVAVAFFTKE